jgi:hypothetical protein
MSGGRANDVYLTVGGGSRLVVTNDVVVQAGNGGNGGDGEGSGSTTETLSPAAELERRTMCTNLPLFLLLLL